MFRDPETILGVFQIIIKPKSKRDEDTEGVQETLIHTGAEESFETLVDFFASVIAISVQNLRSKLAMNTNKGTIVSNMNKNDLLKEFEEIPTGVQNGEPDTAKLERLKSQELSNLKNKS
jgi:hypothetical protein